MIVLDFSIVNVALPSIQSQFHLTPTKLQWVVSAYALTFGGFLLLGGRASDLFNRKMIFMIGLIVFSLASLLGGLATSAVLIFISRAIQGIGASMHSPSALSLLTTTFPEGGERNRALGIFSSMAAIGFTTGVILGGILTSSLSWHWDCGSNHHKHCKLDRNADALLLLWCSRPCLRHYLPEHCRNRRD